MRTAQLACPPACGRSRASAMVRICALRRPGLTPPHLGQGFAFRRRRSVLNITNLRYNAGHGHRSVSRRAGRDRGSRRCPTPSFPACRITAISVRFTAAARAEAATSCSPTAAIKSFSDVTGDGYLNPGFTVPTTATAADIARIGYASSVQELPEVADLLGRVPHQRWLVQGEPRLVDRFELPKTV